MSLVNKMLSDLEQRHSYSKDHDQIVLGGLAPVAETGFSSLRLPYNFLFVCFCVVALSIAVYGYQGGVSRQPTAGYETPVQTRTFPAAVPETVSLDNNVTSDLPDMQPPVMDKLSGLKLDLSLPADVEVVPISEIAGIRNIDVSIAGEVTTLHLLLDSSAGYIVYPLENPDRVVLEIDKARLLTPVPAIVEHPYIERLRFSERPGEKLTLVVDSVRPVLIENTAIEADTNGYVLTVRLRSESDEGKELIPAVENVKMQGETDSERMEVKPSTVGTGALDERLLAEARGLYANRNFREADEKILGVLKQQPSHVHARLLYASALINRGEINMAAQVLEAGLKLNPGTSEWAKIYARILVNQGQTGQAIDVLAGALPEISSDNDYYALYAALLQRVSRHDEASEYYRLLLAQQPENGLWWMGLAISLDALKRMEDALYSYHKALEGQALNQELREYVLQQIERLSG